MGALTNTGFKRYTYAELLNLQIAKAKELFGNDIDTSEQTILGKFIRLNISEISELYKELELIYYARFPHTATGMSLDRLCPFAGIQRNPATRAIHTIKITGVAGATIENGFLVSTIDEINFYLVNDVTLDEDGEATASVQCVELGTVGNVNIGAITGIVNPSPNVTGIEHIAITSIAVNLESDAALRERFDKSISGASSSTIDSIYGEVMRTNGVTGCLIIENMTNTTDSEGRPANSYECYVLGGQDIDIANAIFKKSPVGIKMAGITTVNVTDKAGISHEVKFSRTTEKTIYVQATIKVDSHFEDTGSAEIESNLVYHIAGLTNGEDVIYSSLFTDIYKVAGVVEVSDLKLSINGTTYNTSNIACTSGEVARLNTDNIEIEVETYADSY